MLTHGAKQQLVPVPSSSLQNPRVSFCHDDHNLDKRLSCQDGRGQAWEWERPQVAGHLEDHRAHLERVREREELSQRLLAPVLYAILVVRQRAENIFVVRELEGCEALVGEAVREQATKLLWVQSVKCSCHDGALVLTRGCMSMLRRRLLLAHGPQVDVRTVGKWWGLIIAAILSGLAETSATHRCLLMHIVRVGSRYYNGSRALERADCGSQKYYMYMDAAPVPHLTYVQEHYQHSIPRLSALGPQHTTQAVLAGGRRDLAVDQNQPGLGGPGYPMLNLPISSVLKERSANSSSVSGEGGGGACGGV